MTRSQTKALMPVLVAWAEGREVQFSHKNHTEWSTEMIPDPNFEAEGFQWRVKPQPREFWVALPKDGGASVAVFTFVPIPDERFDIIHVREVVE